MKRAPRTPPDWIVCDNLRCGGMEVMKVPVPIEAFILQLKAFAAEHLHCKPAASHPEGTD